MVELGEDLASGVDGDGAADVAEVGVGAGAVDGEHVGLVLDGACDGESSPVVLAGVGPVCAEAEALGASEDLEAEEFWKAKVVADGRRDARRLARVGPLEGFDVIAGAEPLALASETEGVDLGVLAEEVGGGVEDGGAIGREGVARFEDGSSALDEDLEIAGESGEGVEGASVGVGGALDIETEPGVEHLGEDGKVAGRDIGRCEQIPYTMDIGRGVFPGDVKLDEVGAHGRVSRGEWGR